MAQGRSTMSGNSETMNAEDAAKLEIAEVNNQFRIMKREQRAYEIQVREQICKQEQEIGKLLGDREEVHRNLAARKCLSRQRQDGEEIQALVEQNKGLDREMENEKQRQKQLQTEIMNMETRLVEVRKGGVSCGHSQSSNARRAKKAMRTLESNVNRASTQFSDLMTKNTQIKEELDTLCLERDHFQKLRSNLTKELQKNRRSIEEMMKLSTASYTSGEEALSKMNMLRDKAMKDLVQYNTEMKELERVIAHEFNLKNFISTKCTEQTGQSEDKTAPEQLSDVKEPRKVNSGEESLDNLKEAFENLQTVMGEDNLDLLVNSYIQAKDRNLAFLKFVNEQNSEAVKLKDQISKIKEEMQKCDREGLQQERKHLSLLNDVEAKLKETQSQAETYEKQAEVLSKILDQVKIGVSSIFSEIGCDQSAVEDKLGFSAGITESNIMTYLDLVEEKTNKLVTVKAFLEFKDLKEDFSPADLAKSLLGQNPELFKRDLRPDPSISSLEHDGEDSPVTDEDERPLSHAELRRKIMKHTARPPRGGTPASKLSYLRNKEDGL